MIRKIVWIHRLDSDMVAELSFIAVAITLCRFNRYRPPFRNIFLTIVIKIRWKSQTAFPKLRAAREKTLDRFEFRKHYISLIGSLKSL
jgi:hypothetical protein